MKLWRDEPRPSDPSAVRSIIGSSGFFSDAEIGIAVELVRERLERGLASGYRFLFADDLTSGSLAGYACYGEIPCTVGSYDLYWIAVDPERRRHGLGRALLAELELRVKLLGGRRIYIETSGRELYRPTQGFYRSCGYVLEAQLADFYGFDDPKLIFVKTL